MTKRHFIALADAIKTVQADTCATPFTEFQIQSLADFCQSQNSNFNRERWLDYIAGNCGPNGGSRKAA